jgi:hypothetical protein
VTFVTLLATFFWLTNKSEARTGDNQNIQQPAANTLLSRFISLSVSAAKPYANADFDNLGSPQRFRYMSFPGSGYSALLTDFTLPPDYAAGTDVRVRFMVNSVGDCFVVLGADSVYESPAVSAGAYIQFPDGDPPDFNPQWTAHSDELRPFSVSIQEQPSNPFLPGDSISIALARYGDELNDTCGEILISGISVTYDGLTSFLPLVTH